MDEIGSNTVDAGIWLPSATVAVVDAPVSLSSVTYYEICDFTDWREPAAVGCARHHFQGHDGGLRRYLGHEFGWVRSSHSPQEATDAGGAVRLFQLFRPNPGGLAPHP